MPVVASVVVAWVVVVGLILFVAFLVFRLRTNGTIEFTAKPRLTPLIDGKQEPFIELRLEETDSSRPE